MQLRLPDLIKVLHLGKLQYLNVWVNSVWLIWQHTIDQLVAQSVFIQKRKPDVIIWAIIDSDNRYLAYTIIMNLNNCRSWFMHWI